MKSRLVAAIGLIALFLTSCIQAPEGARSTAGDALSVNEKAKGIAYSVDTTVSQIEWLGTKPGGEHFGTVKLSGGKVYVDNGTVTGGTFKINMNSIEVLDIKDENMNKTLLNHLLSSDFFLVDSFPQAKFQIVEVTPSKATYTNHSVVGNLTLRGSTRSISFSTNINIADNKITVVTPQFVLNRTDWGVNYGSRSLFANLKDNFIHDEMGLKISLVAYK